MKFNKMLDEINEHNIVLPNFQRAMEWKEDNQKKLLASFLIKLPIGSFLLLHGSDQEFVSKEICYISKEISAKGDTCIYLLDGQQRISTLKAVFYDFYQEFSDWEEEFDSIYYNLRLRWFLRVKPNDGEEDIFGYKRLRFNQPDAIEPEQILPFIKSHRIYKTKAGDWFNPGYKPEEFDAEDSAEVRNYYIAGKAADNGYVPLYSIYNNNSDELSLHEESLNLIARKRVDILKRALHKNDSCIIEGETYCFYDLLSRIKPKRELQNFRNDESESEIDMCWYALASQWAEKFKSYIESLLNENLHIIELPEGQMSRAISIFESINKGGTPLSIFDLIVARAARDRNLPSLTQRITDVINEKIELSDIVTSQLTGISELENAWKMASFGVIDPEKLSNTLKDQYLNILSLLSSNKESSSRELTVEYIKRGKILDLTANDINTNTPTALKALSRAFAFLHFRCGVINIKDVPYELMIVPIAFILEKDDNWNNKSVMSKLEYWYWSSIFGGAYRSGQNERCIKDVKYLLDWLNNGENHFKYFYDKLFDEAGYSNEEVLLLKDEERELKKPIIKGIMQYILRQQPKDLLPDEYGEVRLNTWDIAAAKTYEVNGNVVDLDYEEHHIIPLSTAAKVKESTKQIREDKSHILNSPLNITPISRTANNFLSSKTPQEYLNILNELNALRHFIPSEAFVKKQNESDGVFYERALKERLKVIKNDMKLKLDNLKDS